MPHANFSAIIQSGAFVAHAAGALSARVSNGNRFEVQFHPASGDAVEIDVVDDQLLISDNLLDRLGRTVTQAPENSTAFTARAQPAGAFRIPGR